VIIPPARRPARPAPVAQPCASGGGTVRAWFDPRGQSIPELSCEARSELKALDRSDPVGLWRNVWCEWTQNESERPKASQKDRMDCAREPTPRDGPEVCTVKPRFCQGPMGFQCSAMFRGCSQRTEGKSREMKQGHRRPREWAEAQIMRALDG
jgi:hypothetical protein